MEVQALLPMKRKLNTNTIRPFSRRLPGTRLVGGDDVNVTVKLTLVHSDARTIDMVQQVNGPTHNRGNTPDLVRPPSS